MIPMQKDNNSKGDATLKKGEERDQNQQRQEKRENEKRQTDEQLFHNCRGGKKRRLR
jgi:hypothetical protein